MITAVDTNVLLDVVLPDPTYAKESTELLQTAYDEGALIISHLVYAELVPQFGSKQVLADVLSQLGIEAYPTDDEIAFVAGVGTTVLGKNRTILLYSAGLLHLFRRSHIFGHVN